MALCKKVKFKLTFLYKHFTDLIVAKYKYLSKIERYCVNDYGN